MQGLLGLGEFSSEVGQSPSASWGQLRCPVLAV